MADTTLSDMKFNRYMKNAFAAGRVPIDRAKWDETQGKGSAEAPKKEGAGEKFWNYETVKRHKEWVKEREKVGGKTIDLDTWAKINKGEYQE